MASNTFKSMLCTPVFNKEKKVIGNFALFLNLLFISFYHSMLSFSCGILSTLIFIKCSN